MKMMYNLKVLSILVMIILLAACSGNKEGLYEEMAKIDAHVHIRTSEAAFMEYAKSEGFKLLSINTRSDSQNYIDQQKAHAVKA